MTRSELEHVIRAAGAIAEDSEIIVIGSQSILGQFPDAPRVLLMSAEADVYPLHHPERADLIDGSIGEIKPDVWGNQTCLAMTYGKLGRHADAEGVLAKLKASLGDDAAYQYAEIYTQWGDVPKVLEWLDTALRLRDSGLVNLKTDPLLDPLRHEPRFKAIEQALKFPT